MYVPALDEIIEGALDFKQNFNTIKAVTESTCGDKWSILAETALPAAGDAMLLFLTPSPEEILENYLRPSPTRGGAKGRNRGHGTYRKGKTGRRRWWRGMSPPDPDQSIADRIPGRGVFAGRNAGSLERFLWTGIDILDKIGWYWLLIEVTDTFVSSWASGIMESRFCTSPFDAMFVGSVNKPLDFGSRPLWNNIEQLEVKENQGWEVGSNGDLTRIERNQETTGRVLITANLTPIGSPLTDPLDSYIQVRWWEADGTQHLIEGEHKNYNPTRSMDLELEFEPANMQSLSVSITNGNVGSSGDSELSSDITMFLDPIE